MKAKEIPERLYLSKNIYSTYLYQVPDPDDDTAIEYTHTDAFIEKACRWLSLNLQMLLNVFDVEYHTNDTKAEDFINDFRKAMEE